MDKIGPEISKENTRMRDAVPVPKRVAIHFGVLQLGIPTIAVDCSLAVVNQQQWKSWMRSQEP